jgi:hypothetical protein
VGFVVHLQQTGSVIEVNDNNDLSRPEKNIIKGVVFLPSGGLNLASNPDRPCAVKIRIIAIVLFLSLLAGTGTAHSAAGGMPYGMQSKPYAGLAWFLIGFELGPWEEYLIHELTPNLDRLKMVDEPRVSWLELDGQLVVPDFARSMIASESSRLEISLRRAQSPIPFSDFSGLRHTSREGYRFEQSLVMPGITHRVSDQSAFTVSAILASQRFGASGMNLRESDGRIGSSDGWLAYDPAQMEVSHGAGLRFALSSEMIEGVKFEAAFQSRIDMSEFATVRGVHGAHAELDIPPRLQLGLQLSATDRSWLNVGVSQIFYSEIGAFPSRSLPARFTALLGDSGSPNFAWDDLVVYNLGWHWRHESDLELYFDYRTRSQPSPTAPSLASALNSELAQNSMLMGVSKGLGNSRVHLNAAYAPPEFAFGGNVLGVVSDKLDQDLEFQALWNLTF